MENQNNSRTETENPIKKDSGVGPIIGSVIIIILIILGGLYFWSYTINKQKSETPSQEQKVEQVNSFEIADPELAQINNELNATSTDNIDTELNQIDAEIDAAIE